MDGEHLPMKPNLLKQGALMENSAGLGTVTRQMVRERAAELAVINRPPGAERFEVGLRAGEAGVDRRTDTSARESRLESVPESARWDPVLGSTGFRVPASPSEDEDEEARSDEARLTEQGIVGAEHDLMRKASQSLEG